MLEKYKKAGKIVSRIKGEVIKTIRPGMKLLDLVKFIEKEVTKTGAGFAFPPNISVNEITAHYTPSINDDKIIKEGDLVKIDIGVHIDGYIGDMAFTYCSEKNVLKDVAEKSVKNAIKIIKPGISISEIGNVIEETVLDAGLGVITNLTGHGLKRYEFHAQPSILNIRNDSTITLKEGDVIAIEPFITYTHSKVKESGIKEIYRYLRDKPTRMVEARKILLIAKKRYHSLPFAKRWLCEFISPLKVSLALKQLESSCAIESYPVLKEINGRKTAQAEHTIIVSNPPIVTTKDE